MMVENKSWSGPRESRNQRVKSLGKEVSGSRFTALVDLDALDGKNDEVDVGFLVGLVTGVSLVRHVGLDAPVEFLDARELGLDLSDAGPSAKALSKRPIQDVGSISTNTGPTSAHVSCSSSLSKSITESSPSFNSLNAFVVSDNRDQPEDFQLGDSITNSSVGLKFSSGSSSSFYIIFNGSVLSVDPLSITTSHFNPTFDGPTKAVVVLNVVVLDLGKFSAITFK
ncbi:hypothetical protein Golax_020608 [Gossypium laxum]|uniref:Uncharacterized protein n=1 Tax=Gossypium laxum TaxID=34288 RepID=A0A7J9B4H6_9ROSI|nr:hypothetical protein [Gossypium laxum]